MNNNHFAKIAKKRNIKGDVLQEDIDNLIKIREEIIQKEEEINKLIESEGKLLSKGIPTRNMFIIVRNDRIGKRCYLNLKDLLSVERLSRDYRLNREYRIKDGKRWCKIKIVSLIADRREIYSTGGLSLHTLENDYLSKVEKYGLNNKVTKAAEDKLKKYKNIVGMQTDIFAKVEEKRKKVEMELMARKLELDKIRIAHEVEKKIEGELTLKQIIERNRKKREQEKEAERIRKELEKKNNKKVKVIKPKKEKEGGYFGNGVV